MAEWLRHTWKRLLPFGRAVRHGEGNAGERSIV
jgi:hypothetical protein